MIVGLIIHFGKTQFSASVAAYLDGFGTSRCDRHSPCSLPKSEVSIVGMAGSKLRESVGLSNQLTAKPHGMNRDARSKEAPMPLQGLLESLRARAGNVRLRWAKFARAC